MLRFVVYILFAAALIYAFFWVLDRRAGKGGGTSQSRSPRGPMGPDDDEEFLRDLDWQRRRQPPEDESPKK